MITYNLGVFSTRKEVKNIRAALEGKSYMNFMVHAGRGPGPNYEVTVGTEWTAEGLDSESEVAGMIMFLLACNLKEA